MPKTIIFANGIPSTDVDRLRPLIDPADTIICADGGTLHALAMGLQPYLIVGDLDSLPESVREQLVAQGVEIEPHPRDKDQTDLELALNAALARGASDILLLTALGGRLDQQLANLLLLTRPEWQAVRLSLAEANQQAWLLRGPDDLTLMGQPDDTLSVVPLSPQIAGLTLAGVRWPLHHKTVALGDTLTISNRFTTTEARVSLETGLALVLQIKQVTEPKNENIHQ